MERLVGYVNPPTYHMRIVYVVNNEACMAINVGWLTLPFFY